MESLGTVALSVLAGGLIGFANGAGTGGLKHPVKTAVIIGLTFGLLLGGVCLLGGSSRLIVGCIFASTVTGSLIAAITPNDNRIKRYFDLFRYSNRRYKVRVKKGSTYSSEGGHLVEIDAEDGSTVHAYKNALVNAAKGSTVYKYKGALVNADQGATIIDC